MSAPPLDGQDFSAAVNILTVIADDSFGALREASTIVMNANKALGEECGVETAEPKGIGLDKKGSGSVSYEVEKWSFAVIL